MKFENLQTLVSEAAKINGYVRFSGLEFCALLRVNEKGWAVTSMTNPNLNGYMCIKKAGWADLAKVCKSIISRRDEIAAKQEASREAFALR